MLTHETYQGTQRFPQDAIKLGPVRIYVSYSEKDEPLPRKLLEELEPHFSAQNIAVWTPDTILPGETISEERQRALQSCDLTLQLYSPHFQAEKLEENRTARFVPVLLKELSNEPADLKLFRHNNKSFAKSKSADFALELVKVIQDVLAKRPHTYDEELRYLARYEGCFVPGSAQAVSLSRDLELQQEQVSNRCDALEFLNEWLRDPNAPPYCALFGELGMGKTTTAKKFASDLLEARPKNAPAPIFFDLRYVGDFAKTDPTLRLIVTRLLERNWKASPGQRTPHFEEIVRMVAAGALIIFDGLDEVLVHLTPHQGQQFTRQLLSMVPPKGSKGRLLITCRTHYFRTFKEQSSFFTAEDRDNLPAETYRALLLLPFSQAQIQTYLRNTFPPEQAEKAFHFIGSVHNLPELAERPYTLNLITRQIPKLETWKAAGKQVTGLTLYRFVVEEWLLRDNGKHQFNPDHKQMLMEHVAAALVRSGQRSWSVAQLEQWLIDFLEDNPRIAAHYHLKERELLKEDFRTATFLVRDETTDQFRFAHSSLQEYFLAHYLRRALNCA